MLFVLAFLCIHTKKPKTIKRRIKFHGNDVTVIHVRVPRDDLYLEDIGGGGWNLLVKGIGRLLARLIHLFRSFIKVIVVIFHQRDARISPRDVITFQF